MPKGEAKVESLVVATRAGQTVEVTTAEKVSKPLVRLDDRMCDLDRPVEVKHAGKVVFAGIAPRTVGTLVKTLSGRGDPGLVFDAEVGAELPEKK